jgi:hypothetical protein
VKGCDKHRDEWDEDEAPLETRESVKGHLNAKTDDDHRVARNDQAWLEVEPADNEGDPDLDDQGADPDPTIDDPPVEAPEQPGNRAGTDQDGDDDPETTTDEGGKAGDGSQPTTDSDQGDDQDMTTDASDQWNTTDGSTSDEAGKAGEGKDPDGTSDQGADQANQGGIPWVLVGGLGAAAIGAAVLLGGNDDAGPSDRTEADVEQPTDATPEGSDSIPTDGGGLQ